MPSSPQIDASPTAPSTREAPATPMILARPPPTAAPTMPPAPPRTRQAAEVAGEPPARSASPAETTSRSTRAARMPPRPRRGPPGEKDDAPDGQGRGRRVGTPAERARPSLPQQVAGGPEEVEMYAEAGEHPQEEQRPAEGLLRRCREQLQEPPGAVPERGRPASRRSRPALLPGRRRDRAQRPAPSSGRAARRRATPSSSSPGLPTSSACWSSPWSERREKAWMNLRRHVWTLPR